MWPFRKKHTLHNWGDDDDHIFIRFIRFNAKLKHANKDLPEMDVQCCEEQCPCGESRGVLLVTNYKDGKVARWIYQGEDKTMKMGNQGEPVNPEARMPK